MTAEILGGRKTRQSRRKGNRNMNEHFSKDSDARRVSIPQSYFSHLPSLKSCKYKSNGCWCRTIAVAHPNLFLLSSWLTFQVTPQFTGWAFTNPISLLSWSGQGKRQASCSF